MSNFYEELKKYFENTPREKVLEDWDKSKKWDEVGPTLEEFLEQQIQYSNEYLNNDITTKIKTIKL